MPPMAWKTVSGATSARTVPASTAAAMREAIASVMSALARAKTADLVLMSDSNATAMPWPAAEWAAVMW